jgi:ATP-binding cassette subfamily B protein
MGKMRRSAGRPGGGGRHRRDRQTERLRQDDGGLRRVVGYFRPQRGRVAAVILLMALSAPLTLVPAWVTKELLDHLARPGSDFSYLVKVVGFGVAAAVLGGAFTFAQSRLETSISQDLMFQLRGQLYDKLLKQSVSFFTERRVGDVLSRFGNDVLKIGDVIEDTLSGLASNVFILPATLIFMIVLDWRLTAMLPVLVLPWIIASSRRVGRMTYQARSETQERHGAMSSYLQEVLGISGMLLVKAFVRHEAERFRFEGLNSGIRQAQLREARVQRVFDLANTVLLALAPAIFWIFGGWLVLRGQTTLGTLVTFVVVLTGRLAMSVEDLASIHVKLAGSLALFQRLFEIVDLPVTVADAPDATPLSRCAGAVEFDGVTFSYGSGERTALRDLSFQVEPGQLAALVGPTGAGKSTTTYLVARLHDPQLGRVLIDGHDVRSLTLDSIGSQVGIVFQDTFLFNATIRDNLLYARPEASERELVAATRAAYLHDMICELPDGYDTFVGERGHRLSGGEKQRLAIARVILKDPRILVLDEATSHLDTISEHLVQAALAGLFQGRTSLVIAHRLSTILAADLILVLDRGRIVERGTHGQLLERGGVYARLYQQQFRTQPAAVLPSA